MRMELIQPVEDFKSKNRFPKKEELGLKLQHQILPEFLAYYPASYILNSLASKIVWAKFLKLWKTKNSLRNQRSGYLWREASWENFLRRSYRITWSGWLLIPGNSLCEYSLSWDLMICWFIFFLSLCLCLPFPTLLGI